MDNEKMVRMANQVAAYFEVYPEERAWEGVRDHIRNFWPPIMRTQLVAYNVSDGAGLHPLVRRAADAMPETSSLIEK